MAQFAPFILDKLVAPEFSVLTKCEAPELPELPNYVGSMFLNNLFLTNSPDEARPLAIVFLRHLALAFREYRSGRDHLIECVASQSGSSTAIGKYFGALAHFEYVVVRTYLALLAHRAVAKKMLPTDDHVLFRKGDGSPEERLGALYNRFKHYDGDLTAGKTSDRATAVWIVNAGLRCAQDGVFTELKFQEIVEVLTLLADDAKFLSEEAYVLAAQRRAKGQTGAP